MDEIPKIFHKSRVSLQAKWFEGMGPEEFRPVDRPFGADDPNFDLCFEPLKGLDCAIADTDWRLKYPIPLPESKRRRRKVDPEDELPTECPLMKAIREQEEQAKHNQDKQRKPQSGQTMFSNPQEKTPIERITQIVRVGTEKKLYYEALNAIVELL